MSCFTTFYFVTLKEGSPVILVTVGMLILYTSYAGFRQRRMNKCSTYITTLKCKAELIGWMDRQTDRWTDRYPYTHVVQSAFHSLHFLICKTGNATCLGNHSLFLGLCPDFCPSSLISWVSLRLPLFALTFHSSGVSSCQHPIIHGPVIQFH